MTFARPFEILGYAHVASQFGLRRIHCRGGAACLVFAAEGGLEIAFGGRRLVLGPGEAFLAAADAQVHLILSYDMDADFFLLRFTRTDVPAHVPRRTLIVPEHIALCNPSRLKHLFLMLRETARDRSPGWRVRAESRMAVHHIVALMLCEMASSSRRREEASTDGRQTMASRVDAYIAAHYHESIGTPDIAREFRYNPDYLERAYRGERRVSIRTAIHARRIREAGAQLLLQSGRGIVDIAAMCGYSDVGHFRRDFKRATGMTPHEFRSFHVEGLGGSYPLRAV